MDNKQTRIGRPVGGMLVLYDITVLVLLDHSLDGKGERHYHHGKGKKGGVRV